MFYLFFSTCPRTLVKLLTYGSSFGNYIDKQADTHISISIVPEWNRMTKRWTGEWKQNNLLVSDENHLVECQEVL